MHKIYQLILTGIYLLAFATFSYSAGLGEVINPNQLALNIKSDSPKLIKRNAKYLVYQSQTQMLNFYTYTTPDGIVFAIRWHGSIVPNLQTILADYYPEYQIVLQQRTLFHSLHVLSIQTKNIMIQQVGPNNSVTGMAVVKNLVPSGVVLNELN